MKKFQIKQNRGGTLVEVMVAVLVLMVILIGVLSYLYFTAMDARRTDVRVTASRLGLLLLEGWKTVEGADTYDVVSDFAQPPLTDFSNPGSLDDVPGLANLLQGRSFRVDVDGTKYFVKLSYDDAAAPRTLNAAIAWNRDYGAETLDFHSRRLISLTKYANFPIP
jgi:type II secretory pathway pseudopilin PulG